MAVTGGSTSLPLPTSGGGILKKGLGALNSINPYISAISGAIDVGGQVANLFKTSPEGKDKQKATAMQQKLEQAAMQIQEAVNSGKMRPEAAMLALQNLLEQANGMGGTGGNTGNTANFMAGGQGASTIIGNVIANVKSAMMKRNSDYVNQPWGANGDGTDPTGAGGTASLNTGDATEGMKRERLRGGLMDMLTGAQKPFSGPMGNMLNPTSPFDFLDKAQGAVNALPTVTGRKKPDGSTDFNGTF